MRIQILTKIAEKLLRWCKDNATSGGRMVVSAIVAVLLFWITLQDKTNQV